MEVVVDWDSAFFCLFASRLLHQFGSAQVTHSNRIAFVNFRLYEAIIHSCSAMIHVAAAPGVSPRKEIGRLLFKSDIRLQKVPPPPKSSGEKACGRPSSKGR